MRTGILIVAGVVPSLLGAQTSRHTLAGAEVSVYDLVGKVRMVAGTGADVTVEVTRSGADAADLKVESSPIDGRPTLRVIFPADHVTYGNRTRGSWGTTLRVRDDGTFGGDRGRWSGHQVRIDGRSGGLNAAADLVIAVPRGKRVDVNLGVGELSATNVDGEVIIDVASVDLTIDGAKGRWSLDTGSGTVTLRNIAADLTLDAGSGSTTVTGLHSRQLRIDSGSGDVRGSDIQVDELDLDTGSGGIELRGVKAPEIKLDAGSGAVDIELVSDVRSAVIESGSGGVTLRVPKSLGASLEVETGSGGITSDIPVTLTSRSRSHWTGSIGDGNGRIHIETGSGGVRIKQTGA